MNKRFMDTENGKSPAPPATDSAPLPPADQREPTVRKTWSNSRVNPWIVFLLPFLVFMVVGAFEPTKPTDAGKTSTWIDLGIEYRHYPAVYLIKVLLTIAAIGYVLPGYRQVLCQRPSSEDSFCEPSPQMVKESRGIRFGSVPLALFIGIFGTVAWVGLALIQKDVLQRLGWSLAIGERSAFNPLSELASSPILSYGFLVVRFIGLVLVVPVIEEMFLRGFLMRFFVAPDWWRVPMGTVNSAAIMAATVVPMLMHPGEIVAAAIWFSAVTWLLIHTRRLWPCILAHAITNLLMGIYVVASGNWWLM